MKHSLKSVWQNMKSRCNNPNLKSYKNYGGRGITYDPKYELLEDFIKDMGDRPSPQHTIERIDNNGDYVKDNLCWATRADQALNRRSTIFLEIDGVTKCLTHWCRHFNIDYPTIRYRHKCGVSYIEALTNPDCMKKIPIPRKNVKRRGMRLLFTIGTKTKSFAQWCEHYNIHEYQFKQRMLEGQDPLTALSTPWEAINKTGYKGVCWDKRGKNYRACYRANGVRWEKGGFKTAEEAHAAYLIRKGL